MELMSLKFEVCRLLFQPENES